MVLTIVWKISLCPVNLIQSKLTKMSKYFTSRIIETTTFIIGSAFKLFLNTRMSFKSGWLYWVYMPVLVWVTIVGCICLCYCGWILLGVHVCVIMHDYCLIYMSMLFWVTIAWCTCLCYSGWLLLGVHVCVILIDVSGFLVVLVVILWDNVGAYMYCKISVPHLRFIFFRGSFMRNYHISLGRHIFMNF